MLLLHSTRGKHVTCQKTDRRITRLLRENRTEQTVSIRPLKSLTRTTSTASRKPLWHPACFFFFEPSRGVLRRMYGKDNRILCSAEFSQGFKVVAARRTRQAAGGSIGGAENRGTGRGTPWRKRNVRGE